MPIRGSGSAEDRERVLAAQRKRWEYLRYLYDEHQKLRAGHLQSLNGFEVGKAIGVDDRAETDRIFSYLKEAGLIKYMSMGPNVAITRAGIDTVERALAEPEKPTPYFAPINVITVSGGMHGSQIQQGATGSTQVIEATKVEWAELRQLLPEIRAAVTNLSGDAAQRASADIETVEAQSKSPSPRTAIVRECLLSLRSVLEKAGGSLAAEAISSWLKAQGWL
jgi:hypothetical protein